MLNHHNFKNIVIVDEFNNLKIMEKKNKIIIYMFKYGFVCKSEFKIKLYKGEGKKGKKYIVKKKCFY
jgi:hypothetical protein